MSKADYLELCDTLGNEPIEDEMPVDFEELLLEVQEAMQVYRNLQDSWDMMSGTYLGKNLSNIMDIFTLMDIDLEDRRTLFELIGIIDGYRSLQLAAKKPAIIKPP